MKYLSYYENYKTSNKFGDEIGEDEFNLLLQKHCTNYDPYKQKIYRGIHSMSTPDFIFQNPKNHYRHSIEDENIHVLYMSEGDDYKDFPKYDQSVIASTSEKDANAAED